MAIGTDAATSTTAHRSDQQRGANAASIRSLSRRAVLSGAADPDRAARAMAAMDRNLVRRDVGLVMLLTPPFDRSVPDPGYIQAYPPGIRENGGQYTHAAVWSLIAFAMRGDETRRRKSSRC